MDKRIKWMKRHFEHIFEDGSGQMSVSRGKVHEYLGMTLTLDFSKPRQVQVQVT
eukprot:CAMPEP_0178722648 /NCGR_PEP_ID=MMETSP0699-20121125/25090_1 /TAXON_ID=265572 /ORGANISM="Extubocellulus spinifer, Strain CCMP396" /LENGTH=53 /DNA_ID=CAMNT_0020373605 /DNA_START=232 /DNA_END=390 /DNA_ORIENTATION=-